MDSVTSRKYCHLTGSLIANCPQLTAKEVRQLYSYVNNNSLSRIDPSGFDDDPLDEIVADWKTLSGATTRVSEDSTLTRRCRGRNGTISAGAVQERPLHPHDS